MASTSWREIK